MHRLIESGISMADILDSWHEYYIKLDPAERDRVWQEFRASDLANRTFLAEILPLVRSTDYHRPRIAATPRFRLRLPPFAVKAAGFVRSRVHLPPAVAHAVHTVRNRLPIPPAIVRAVQFAGRHFRLRSLGVGAICAAAVVVVFLLSFFNEVVISPFIQPSRKSTNVPVVGVPASMATSLDPKILIPKINIEIPVDYTLQTTEEQSVETALDEGVVHYPTTARPGQPGNAAFFGHSSNNIFNPGKYKFAFVLLDKLEPRDLFFLNYDGRTYTYAVVSTKIVKPSEIGVLGAVDGYSHTATLITCNPPGTSLNRLVVVGKQVSPDPADGIINPQLAAAPTHIPSATALPGNGPTLWSRLWGRVF